MNYLKQAITAWAAAALCDSSMAIVSTRLRFVGKQEQFPYRLTSIAAIADGHVYNWSMVHGHELANHLQEIEEILVGRSWIVWEDVLSYIANASIEIKRTPVWPMATTNLLHQWRLWAGNSDLRVGATPVVAVAARLGIDYPRPVPVTDTSKVEAETMLTILRKMSEG